MANSQTDNFENTIQKKWDLADQIPNLEMRISAKIKTIKMILSLESQKAERSDR